MQPRHLLFFSILVLFSSQFSRASKARLTALASPIHLRDPQLISKYPSYLMETDNFVLIESGSTAATNTSAGAEGLASYSITDESKMMFAVGAQAEAITLPRLILNQAVSATYEMPQNPVTIFYGRKNMGRSLVGGLSYSNKKDKVNNLKESGLGLSLGYRQGVMILAAQASLQNSVSAAGAKEFSGESFYKGFIGFEIDSLSVSIDYAGFVIKEKINNIETQSHDAQFVSASFADTIKKENSIFFYRINLLNQTLKNKSNDQIAKLNVLPLTVGFETQVNTWLTLRSSLKQIVFLNQSNDPVGYGQALPNSVNSTSEFTGGPDSTVAAVGAGFEWNALTLDGSFQGLTGSNASQTLDANTLLTQVSLTYLY